MVIQRILFCVSNQRPCNTWSVGLISALLVVCLKIERKICMKVGLPRQTKKIVALQKSFTVACNCHAITTVFTQAINPHSFVTRSTLEEQLYKVVCFALLVGALRCLISLWRNTTGGQQHLQSLNGSVVGNRTARNCNSRHSCHVVSDLWCADGLDSRVVSQWSAKVPEKCLSWICDTAT